MERISVSKLLLVFVVLMGVCNGVNGVCDETNTYVFPEISTLEYGQEYADIADAGDITSGSTVQPRPLGFVKVVVRYKSPPEPICVSVSGVTGQGIEIMFETDPSAYLCFRDQTGEVQCGQDTFYDCDAAKADTMTYDFYYNVAEGSSQSDITFWLRITKGTVNDQDLTWCHDRDGEYPSSLLIAGPRFSPPPEPTERPNSGSRTSCTILLIASAVILSIVH